jgi:hypothetical protein
MALRSTFRVGRLDSLSDFERMRVCRKFLGYVVIASLRL